MRISTGTSGTVFHSVSDRSSGTSVKTDSIVVSISVNTRSHIVNALHVGGIFHGSYSTSCRRDAAVSDLTV
jgi:hypothetical protein